LHADQSSTIVPHVLLNGAVTTAHSGPVPTAATPASDEDIPF